MDQASYYEARMNHERTLADVVAWASTNENIRLLVLTGSLARGSDAADSLSDLDLELYVRDPDSLLTGRDWYQRFGEVLAVEELENPDWNPTRLIYYIDGKIDFMIAGVAVANDGVEYDRPFRVLIDKDERAGRLRIVSPPAVPPTQEEFSTCVNWFSAAAIMSAKSIVRGELWMAKVRDWDLKEQLLQMIEWDHKARYGWEYDTSYLGTKMHAWMDPDIIAAIAPCWSDFSPQNMRSALTASTALFERLADRSGIALGLAPLDHEAFKRELRRLLSLRHES